MPTEHSADNVLRPIERDLGIAAMVAALFGFALVIADWQSPPELPVDRAAVVGALPAELVETPPVPAPPQLLGIRGDGLRALLGRAEFARAEGAAEMRRYAGPDCTLVVFLYRGANGLVVEHAESRPASTAAGPIAVSACFEELMRQRQLAAAATSTPRS